MQKKIVSNRITRVDLTGFTQLEITKITTKSISNIETKQTFVRNYTIRRSSRRDDLSLTGFTLIEVLISISFLSICLIGIYQAFIVSLDAQLRTDSYNQSIIVAEEQLRLFKQALKKEDKLNDLELTGQVNRGLTVFQWEFSVAPIDSYDTLKQVAVTVDWRRGKRHGQVSLATYLESKSQNEKE
ncbi:MAG: prepilin-type N-terminal cleavage/methylation domain-containing protein [Planctomycetes bacterium]|nr:prepilin-type N-terminal cleavage/methylation domain-containing protein [Planctomycetota bacterium]